MQLSLFWWGGIGLISLNDWKKNISDFLFLDGTVGWNSPLWFLIVLFLCEIIYYGIYSHLQNNNINVVIGLLAIIGFEIQQGGITLPLGLHIVPMSMTFFHIGVVFKKYDMIDKITNNKLKECFIIVCSFIFNMFCGCVMNTRISMYHQEYGNILYFYIAAISGIILYSTIALIISRNTIIELLGRNSLIILSTQYIFFRGYMVLEGKLGIGIMYTENTSISLLITILTLSLYYIIIKVHNKWIMKYTTLFRKIIFP